MFKFIFKTYIDNYYIYDIIGLKGGGDMDANGIVSLISTVGFPIAVCIALFWFINKTMKEFTVSINGFTEALQKNTVMLETMMSFINNEEI